MTKKKTPYQYVVTNTKTGQVGHLVEVPGYVMNGGYVQPSWRIVWDKPNDD